MRTKTMIAVLFVAVLMLMISGVIYGMVTGDGSAAMGSVFGGAIGLGFLVAVNSDLE